jgi:thiamine pyrophosphate-dependent acetolactate synthase large subunit-like protein
MGWWRGEAEMICHADAEVALGQILDAVRESDVAGLITEGEDVKRRSRKLTQSWNRRVRDMEAVELDFTTNTQALIPDSPSSPLHTSFTVPNVIRTLREAIQRLTPSRGERTLILNETVTSFQIVWEHMRPEVPGNMLSSGGSSIGWALAAAVGANLGGTVPTESHSSPSLSSDSVDFTTAANGSGAGEGGGQQGNRFDLIVAIVGDGGFLFGIPSSVYWMARRYNTVRSKCLTFSVH